MKNKYSKKPILDPLGQWNHPGDVTRIPSSNITMQGVTYPVFGIGSNGKTQMMYPGMDYNFGGASYVDEYPLMGNGGYVVTRSNDRKGKTHKVTGPDGTVKYFGDSKLGQHPNDPERKKAFYARHKKNLENNPYFRAFARKTWEKGGQTNDEREMVNGIADILSQVNDVKNRAEIAKEMVKDFNNEDVTYDYDNFMQMSNLKNGGEMIRRADGSYSRRGLWDNIRENKGSGKKPTKEMLEQERKIRRSMQVGGDILEKSVVPTNPASSTYIKKPEIKIPLSEKKKIEKRQQEEQQKKLDDYLKNARNKIEQNYREIDSLTKEGLHPFEIYKRGSENEKLLEILNRHNPKLVNKELNNLKKTGKLMMATGSYIFPEAAPLFNTFNNAVDIVDFIKQPSKDNATMVGLDFLSMLPGSTRSKFNPFTVAGDFIDIQNALLDEKQMGGFVPKYQTKGEVTPTPVYDNIPSAAFLNSETLKNVNFKKESDQRLLKKRQDVYKTIRPSNYDDVSNYFRYLLNNEREDMDDPRSEEAFRMYLNLEKNPKYFSKSKYAPTIKGVPGSTYYKVDDELEQDIFNTYSDRVKLNQILPADEETVESYYSEGTPGVFRDVPGGKQYVALQPGDENIIFGRPQASRARALGNFIVSRGKDKKGEYLSYSDQYDFPEVFQNEMQGKPFKIYNRIYYPQQKTGGENYIPQFDSNYSNTTEKINNTMPKEIRNTTLQKFTKGGGSTYSDGVWYQTGGTAKNTIPVIEDMGGYKDGVFVPNWEGIVQEAKKTGSRIVRTKSGTQIEFDKNWNIKNVDDNPDYNNSNKVHDFKEIMSRGMMFPKKQKGGSLAPVSVPYSREYMHNLQNEYDQFYAPPRSQQDGYDAFFNYKLSKQPLVKNVKGPGWLTTYNDGFEEYYNLDQTPPKDSKKRKTVRVESYEYPASRFVGDLGSHILDILHNKDRNQYKPEFMRQHFEQGGIHINPANKGKFTESAQHARMGVQEFASHVLANKEDYSSTQVKRANFARNASKWNHEEGGDVDQNDLLPLIAKVAPYIFAMGGYVPPLHKAQFGMDWNNVWSTVKRKSSPFIDNSENKKPIYGTISNDVAAKGEQESFASANPILSAAGVSSYPFAVPSHEMDHGKENNTSSYPMSNKNITDTKSTNSNKSTSQQSKTSQDNNPSLKEMIMNTAGLYNYFNNQKKQKEARAYSRAMGMTDNLNPAIPSYMSGLRGDYVQTGTAYGDFRPDEKVVNKGMYTGRFNPSMNTMQSGGDATVFEDGGIYDLTPDQIQYILKNGGTVEFI